GRGRAGRRARRHAGVRLEFEPGGRLPRARAEVERELQGDLEGASGRARTGGRAPTRLSEGRPLPRRQAARARRRLRVPARARRRGVGPDAPPGGTRGSPVLRADRPRLRGKAAGTPRPAATNPTQTPLLTSTVSEGRWGDFA